MLRPIRKMVNRHLCRSVSDYRAASLLRAVRRYVAGVKCWLHALIHPASIPLDEYLLADCYRSRTATCARVIASTEECGLRHSGLLDLAVGRSIGSTSRVAQQHQQQELLCVVFPARWRPHPRPR